MTAPSRSVEQLTRAHRVMNGEGVGPFKLYRGGSKLGLDGPAGGFSGTS